MEPINFLKSAIEEEEALTEDEMEDRNIIVNSDPSDYDEEYYEEENEEDDSSPIGSEAWEDFDYVYNEFLNIVYPKMNTIWDKLSPVAQQNILTLLQHITTTLSDIADCSQNYY